MESDNPACPCCGHKALFGPGIIVFTPDDGEPEEHYYYTCGGCHHMVSFDEQGELCFMAGAW
jgi:hypothetical protein